MAAQYRPPQLTFDSEGRLWIFERVGPSLQIRETGKMFPFAPKSGNEKSGKGRSAKRRDLTNPVTDGWFSKKGLKNIDLIDVGDRVLFFFDELEGDGLKSKVGTVCKNDPGGSQQSDGSYTWTTFLKGTGLQHCLHESYCC